MTTIRTKSFDIRGVKLSAEEGFVLSRVSGTLTLGELVDVSGLPEERIVEILRRLVAEGTLEVDPPFAPVASGPSSARIPTFAPASSPPPGPRIATFAPASSPPPSVRPHVPPSAPAISPPPSVRPHVPPRAPGPSGPPSVRLRSAAVSSGPPSVRAHVPPSAPRTPVASVAPGTGPTIAVCGLSDVGVARSNNEDAFRVVDLTTAASVDTSQQTDVNLGPRGMLLVVCDGMGGENAGEVASALAVEVISSHLASSKEPDAAAALRAAVDHANELVVAAADSPDRKGMGTTVVALLIGETEVYTAEVGDSRAYVLRAGNLVQLSKDQTYVQLLLDQGLMTPETIKGSVAKNVVLQALGKAPELIVAQRRLALRGGDRLLVCSDGLSSYVTDDEIRGVLEANLSLREGCTKLVAMANERGGHDNVTVVTALVGAQLPPPRADESVPDTLSTLRAYAVGEDAG
jgi:serine/threonine protein phosphatase PrpC